MYETICRALRSSSGISYQVKINHSFHLVMHADTQPYI